MSQQADANVATRSTTGVLDGSPTLSSAVPAVSAPREQSRLQSRVRPQRSLWGNAWRQFRRHKLAMGGLIVFIFITLACYVGSPLYPIAINDFDFSIAGGTLSWQHPFGTDSLGQDVLARVLWGGRISIAVGVVA